MIDAPLTVFFVEVDDTLSVGFRGEAMATCGQACHELDVVIDFAVEDYPDRSIFVVDRLIAPGEVDNAQATIAETDIASKEESIAVGPTMPERGRHPAQQILIHPSVRVSHADARDAAHGRDLLG